MSRLLMVNAAEETVVAAIGGASYKGITAISSHEPVYGIL